MYEDVKYENDDKAELHSALDEKKVKKNTREVCSYRLGEEIANGIRFFGQVETNKHGQITAMCVCPKCGESWRASINNIRRGNTTSCGCI